MPGTPENKYDFSLELQNPLLKYLVECIKPNSIVLEFGPAMGRLTKYMRENLNCRVYIVELDKEAYKNAVQYAADGLCGDIESIPWEHEFSGIAFDYILFQDVLEHLVEPVSALRRALPLLKEDGQLVCTVPNIAYGGVIMELLQNRFKYRPIGILDGTHLRFYTFDNILRLLTDSGYAPLVIKGFDNHIRNSEFSCATEKLPREIVNYIQDMTWSNHYQYLFVAVNDVYFQKNKDLLRQELGDNAPKCFQSLIYYDSGNGFSEEQKLTAWLEPSRDGSVTFCLPEIEGLVQLRWDPLKDRTMRCADVSLRYNGSTIQPYGCNADMRYKGTDIFYSMDPSYLFSAQALHGGEIIIHYNMTVDYDKGAEFRLQMIKSLNTQVAQLQKDLKIQQEEINRQDAVIQYMLNSKSWRITQWMRELYKKLKRNKLVRKVYWRMKRYTLFRKMVAWVRGVVAAKNNASIQIQRLNSFEDRLTLTPQLPKDTYPSTIDAIVTFIIPTFNAGKEFSRLLYMLRSQKGLSNLEILVVDSGSEDETAQIAEYLGVRVIHITQDEFSHSYSRNLGAKHARGEYLFFMTQDAMPSGFWWARRILEPLIADKVVAATCMESARPDAELYYKINIFGHLNFMGVNGQDRIGEMPVEQDYLSVRRNAQLTDVACAVRTDIFMKYRYRGDYAEDLDLGLRLIKDNYRLGFLSSEVVIHSHNRPALYHFKRSIVETARLKEIFPNMELNAYDKDSLLCSLIQGYQQMHYICDILCNWPTDNISLEMFRVQMETHLQVPYEQVIKTSITDENARDIEFHNALIPLFNLAGNNTSSKYNMEDVFYNYFKYSAIPYLAENIDTLGKEDIQETGDCFLKYYAVFAGHLIAAYISTVTEKDEIYEYADSLKGGI